MTLTGSPHPGPAGRTSAHPEPAPIFSPDPAPIPAPAGPAGSGRAALAAALRGASYEVLPLRGIEEKVLAHVPTEVALTVTTTEAKGPEPTVDLAIRLVRHGYRAAPHLAARLVRDRAHLADIGARLREAGVTGVVVIGGDAAEPLGPYPDASSLLDGLAERGHTFASVGIGGYPEGHRKIPGDVLRKQQSMVWRFFLPGGYRPDRLVQRLTPAFAGADNGLAGFHVYTFNDLDSTEAWRRRWLARLA